MIIGACRDDLARCVVNRAREISCPLLAGRRAHQPETHTPTVTLWGALCLCVMRKRLGTDQQAVNLLFEVRERAMRARDSCPRGISESGLARASNSSRIHSRTPEFRTASSQARSFHCLIAPKQSDASGSKHKGQRTRFTTTMCTTNPPRAMWGRVRGRVRSGVGRRGPNRGHRPDA